MAKQRQTLTFHFQAKSDKLARDLVLVNRKLAMFRTVTKFNMDQVRNSFVGAFGGFLVLNAVTSAIKSLAGFELQMDKVQAISGATNEKMKELTASSLKLGRTTIFTSTEIGKMQETLARLGFSPDRILASSEAISKLALVTSTELSEAAETMAGTLNGFNLEATDSGRIANVMAESFAKSALNMEKFTVGTANSSAIARVFGATVEENTARLGKLVDSNIDASKAGTDLRRMYINLNEKGLTWDEGMQKIASSTDKLDTAVELFDVRAAGSAVILSGLQGETKLLATELGDANKEIDVMAKVMSGNLSTDIKLFTSAIDGTVQRMTGLRDKTRSYLQELTAWMNFVNNDAIPTAKRWTGALTGGVLPGIRDLYTEEAKLLELEKERVRYAITFTNQIGVRSTAQLLYNKAIDKSVLGVEAMLLAEKMAFNPNVANIRIELLRIIAEVEKKRVEDINKQSTALKEAALAQEEYTKKYKKFIETYKLQIGTKTGEAALVHNTKGALMGDKTPMERLTNLDIEGGSAAVGNYSKQLKQQELDQKEYAEATKRQVDELNQIVRDSISHGIGAFVETLASGGGIEAAFKGLLGVIGDGLVGLGKTLVAYGVALDAFKKAIGNPFVAIGAGVAAIAIGSLFKKQASNMSGSAGGGGGGGSSGPSGSYIGGAFNQNRIEGQFTVRGSDLVYILGRQGQLDGRQKAG
jgi:hypothetical protein